MATHRETSGVKNMISYLRNSTAAMHKTLLFYFFLQSHFKLEELHRSHAQDFTTTNDEHPQSKGLQPTFQGKTLKLHKTRSRAEPLLS
jgi:hypothetical protein